VRPNREESQVPGNAEGDNIFCIALQRNRNQVLKASFNAGSASKPAVQLVWTLALAWNGGRLDSIHWELCWWESMRHGSSRFARTRTARPVFAETPFEGNNVGSTACPAMFSYYPLFWAALAEIVRSPILNLSTTCLSGRRHIWFRSDLFGALLPPGFALTNAGLGVDARQCPSQRPRILGGLQKPIARQLVRAKGGLSTRWAAQTYFRSRSDASLDLQASLRGALTKARLVISALAQYPPK
jgi:hypothetical protein